jgi:hypothetical protein
MNTILSRRLLATYMNSELQILRLRYRIRGPTDLCAPVNKFLNLSGPECRIPQGIQGSQSSIACVCQPSTQRGNLISEHHHFQHGAVSKGVAHDLKFDTIPASARFPDGHRSCHKQVDRTWKGHFLFSCRNVYSASQGSRFHFESAK